MAKFYVIVRLISHFLIPLFKNCNIDKKAFADVGCVFNGVNMGRYSYSKEPILQIQILVHLPLLERIVKSGEDNIR